MSTFEGLHGLDGLRYLYIGGTLDWNQPIEDFTFFAGLPNLEAFRLGFIINKSPYPVLLPILRLTKLKKIHFGRATFKAREYAFVMAAIPNVEGCNWELCWRYSGNYDLLGKRAGFVKWDAPNTEKRCAEFVALFEQIKKEATVIVHQCEG